MKWFYLYTLAQFVEAMH